MSPDTADESVTGPILKWMKTSGAKHAGAPGSARA
jgi:hypothetical protein